MFLTNNVVLGSHANVAYLISIFDSETWKGIFLTRSLVLGFSMLALPSSDFPPLLPALSDLSVKLKSEWIRQQINQQEE